MALELSDAGSPSAEVAPRGRRAPARGNATRLTGRHKAAVLLVSLGADRAAEVFRHMREEEIESLSLEMAKIQQVDSSMSSTVFEELAATVEAYDSLAAGGVEFAREALEKALGGERAAEIIGRLTTIIEKRPFEFLRRTPPDQIVSFLHSEAPQTVALVIANLHTTLASQVLSRLPQEEQAEIALRIARMSETSPDVVRQVEKVMRDKLASVIQQEYSASGGVRSLADILNASDRSTEQNVLGSLSSSDPQLEEEVRRLLFVFEDIVKLDDRAIQLVLREADQKDLALALRGVSEDVTARILGNLSQRGAEMLREEMEYQPPQRKRVVEEAQGRIVAIVRRLEESGDIVLGRGGDDVV
jgi:flagellar motor switch protein FliG